MDGRRNIVTAKAVTPELVEAFERLLPQPSNSAPRLTLETRADIIAAQSNTVLVARDATAGGRIGEEARLRQILRFVPLIVLTGTGVERRRPARSADNGRKCGRKSEFCANYYGRKELPFKGELVSTHRGPPEISLSPV